MSGRGCNSRKPVKIVIINTQYVETDATSFKSVVQKLTGKDSDYLESKAEKAEREERLNNQVGVEVHAPEGGLGKSFLMRDVSFKEFDRFFSEISSLNDIWAD
ncbi:hypothetical protein TanjilG_31893 [Lupinus angustifolius]|uniref:VQ domain-containing protein n=1 Tax=Lupinus angustifolius TaxID=3871 RepID=A0A394D8X5_LUPAN|nr:PREDICTED: VQ motif-containing protein 10-like [Lupinus angustifolius]OIW19996.1 hypothetical protein TanjilG_31893 [Lupinus angustifolius]